MTLQPSPAKRLGNQRNFGRRLEEPRIEVVSIHILQFQGRRVQAWLIFIDVTYSMRSQVDLPILLVWQFKLALI